ncbi:MAG TPA: hypothetical protein VMU84_13725 [Thermoanaerobaculia bacterium]|nr:hypothetical protein [Thermoanaerobaculia bacterium]
MRLRPWREVLDQLVGAFAFVIVLLWAAYVWERSTGLTFATRKVAGTISTPAHLRKTRNIAIGTTIGGAPIVILYFVVVRSKRNVRG